MSFGSIFGCVKKLYFSRSVLTVYKRCPNWSKRSPNCMYPNSVLKVLTYRNQWVPTNSKDFVFSPSPIWSGKFVICTALYFTAGKWSSLHCSTPQNVGIYWIQILLLGMHCNYSEGCEKAGLLLIAMWFTVIGYNLVVYLVGYLYNKKIVKDLSVCRSVCM